MRQHGSDERLAVRRLRALAHQLLFLPASGDHRCGGALGAVGGVRHQAVHVAVRVLGAQLAVLLAPRLEPLVFPARHPVCGGLLSLAEPVLAALVVHELVAVRVRARALLLFLRVGIPGVLEHHATVAVGTHLASGLQTHRGQARFLHGELLQGHRGRCSSRLTRLVGHALSHAAATHKNLLGLLDPPCYQRRAQGGVHRDGVLRGHCGCGSGSAGGTSGSGQVGEGRHRDVEKLSVGVPDEHVFAGAELVPAACAVCDVSSALAVARQHLRGRGRTVLAVQRVQVAVDLDAQRRLEQVLRDARGDHLRGLQVVAHLVDGQHAGAKHLSGAVHEGGEHQAGAIAQQHRVREDQSLEVLRLSGPMY
eukprot:Colp12_sorted_trinity150504_noHs@16683